VSPRIIKVKPLEEISKHYREAAGTAASRYADAIPRIEWKDPALAGQDLYETQMKKDEILKRRKAGIEKVTDEEFRKILTDIGAKRIRTGIEYAVPKQAARYKPIRDALHGMEVPDKTDDWEENIDKILKPVVRKMKEAAGKL